MKYFFLFLAVLLLSFGLLQWQASKETTTTTTTIPEQPLSPTVAPPAALIDSTASAVDTTSYTLIDGFIQVSWKTLAKIDFEERFTEAIDQIVAYPLFSPAVKALDQKNIQIQGYVIPFEETGNETIVILSAFPFSNCFFCGGAGPESVIDVQMKSSRQKFKRDAMTTFRGKLRLNDTDLDYLNYILEDAEVVD